MDHPQNVDIHIGQFQGPRGRRGSATAEILIGFFNAFQYRCRSSDELKSSLLAELRKMGVPYVVEPKGPSPQTLDILIDHRVGVVVWRHGEFLRALRQIENLLQEDSVQSCILIGMEKWLTTGSTTVGNGKNIHFLHMNAMADFIGYGSRAISTEPRTYWQSTRVAQAFSSHV